MSAVANDPFVPSEVEGRSFAARRASTALDTNGVGVNHD